MTGPVPPAATIRPPGGWAGWGLGEMWRTRSIAQVLARRSLMVRYRQTAVGATWVVLQPVLMMAVFTVFLGIFAGVGSGDIPYPVFVYTALLLWGAVSKTVAEGTGSLIANGGLLRELWFPRVHCPLSIVLASLVDLLVACVPLAVLLLLSGIVPGPALLAAPLFLALGYAAALGVTLWLSALNVAWRDVGHLLPFLLQVWFFTSPVVYPSSIVPPELRVLHGLNPLVGAIDGFRWSVLDAPPPDPAVLAVGILVAAAVLLSGYVFFRLREPGFADLV